MPQAAASWNIEDDGAARTLTVGARRFKTPYSVTLIELLIARKGVERASQFLVHRTDRAWFLNPLFDTLNKTQTRLRVLEVGCSAGHLTEYLNEQACVEAVYSFDVDKAFVDIVRLKQQELGLHKVKRIDHFPIRSTRALPYESEYFDLVIVAAVVEHLPFESRHRYVDEYYRVLKEGGLVGFWDTPNRYYPLESHSVGLPFISHLPPQVAYAYARLFKRSKMRSISFPLFVRPGTGWRNSSYYELLPKSLMADIEDVSAEFGYQPGCGWWGRVLAKLLRVPPAFFSPSFNLVFKKVRQYD
jgi:2-polyprenyl-3-methyl-5-hydroxy-6-metoxy-1,4-benzoquinol methylase